MKRKLIWKKEACYRMQSADIAIGGSLGYDPWGRPQYIRSMECSANVTSDTLLRSVQSHCGFLLWQCTVLFRYNWQHNLAEVFKKFLISGKLSQCLSVCILTKYLLLTMFGAFMLL